MRSRPPGTLTGHSWPQGGSRVTEDLGLRRPFKKCHGKLLSFSAAVTHEEKAGEGPADAVPAIWSRVHAHACTAKGVTAMADACHTAEPEAGSLRTADGREADLFTLEHYPIDAVCRECQGAIRSRSYVLPFEHLDPGAAQDPHA
jgi:hypothetical protein